MVYATYSSNDHTVCGYKGNVRSNEDSTTVDVGTTENGQQARCLVAVSNVHSADNCEGGGAGKKEGTYHFKEGHIVWAVKAGSTGGREKEAFLTGYL
jgi:hypothetical protein